MDKILVVVAHPDDEVLGMGGTIAKLTAEGKRTHLLIVTDGSSSQYKNSENLAKIIEDKMQETQNAANILGITSIAYGKLPDMKLDVTPHTEINKVIENEIATLQPDTVFTHFHGDVNLDHQAVYRSVAVACRPVAGQCVRELYCFNVPSSTEWNPYTGGTMFMPNVFVNITAYACKKYMALESYKTELRDYPHPRSIEHIRIQDKAEGLKVGWEAAETFMCMRKMVG